MPDSSRPTTDDPPTCIGCGTPLTGRYCTECGESASSGRLTVRGTIASVIDGVLEVDSPLVRTLRDLTIRPGAACRAYIDGRRRQYANPFRYCLIAAATYVLAIQVLGVDMTRRLSVKTGGNTPEETDQLQQMVAAVRDHVQAHLNIFVFFALPVFALALRVLLRRQPINYAEHLSFVLFVQGQKLLFLTLVALLGLMESPLLVVPLGIITISYVVWAVRGCYRIGWFAASWRTLIAVFLTQVTVIVLAMLSAFIVVVLPTPST